MTDFVIPCDTFVRLSNVLHDLPEPADEWFNAVRIDNGQAVATNRKVMAIENIGGPAGVVHVIADPVLIAQCRTEAPFSSKLTITVNDMLKFAVAKTTLGYVHPGNCAVWSDSGGRADFDKWRTVVMSASVAAQKSKGGMFWAADDIARLAAASPSGRVVFAENIEAIRPTLMRDIHDHDWLGVFNPFSTDDTYSPATLPTWMTA